MPERWGRLHLARTIVSSIAALAGVTVLASPTPALAQVFLASTPNPQFSIGPLFVSAIVTPDLGPTTVNISWSLSVPPPRQLSDIAQDLYLLWPAEIVKGTAPGRADPGLARYLVDRGFDVLSDGRLTIRSRDRSLLGTATPGQPLPVTASYVTFVRRGAAPAQIGAGTYIKIPWVEKMADPLSVSTLSVAFSTLITPRPATWLEELFWGRRWTVTASFGDVGSLALSVYPMYFEHRNRVIHLARDFSLLIVNFEDADHLRIDEIIPATATRRGSRTRAGSETVSLALTASETVTPQILRAHFSYFSGRIAWRPIVISLALLLLGNLTGAIMLGQFLAGGMRRRFHVGRPDGGPVTSGVVLPADRVRSITPRQSRYEDVVQSCGRATEERQWGESGQRQSLVYRGTRSVTYPRWAVGWFAAVGHREIEHHEVTVELEDGGVREVNTIVRRVRD